jgi:hypothetical protein
MPAVGASEDRMAARTGAKIIISCAVTGGIHTPTMSDALKSADHVGF